MAAATLILMAAAMLADAVMGDPPRLWRRLPHPVVLMGRIVAHADTSFNHESAGDLARRLAGCGALLLLLLMVGSVAWLLHRLLAGIPGGFVVEAVLAGILIAQRSLVEHVRDVEAALRLDGLAAGRVAVSRIVGRDTADLDEAGVRRAALESLGENLSDGVVAPVFWGCLFGLPGIAVYKAINTADSMIGHRTPRYRAFGWAAARLDDLANWLPARLTGLLIALAAGRHGWRSLRVMRRDARRHRSPNAGWPEAALAGALNVRLCGPRHYAGQPVLEPWLNPAGADPRSRHLRAALHMTISTCLALGALLLALAGLAWWLGW